MLLFVWWTFYESVCAHILRWAVLQTFVEGFCRGNLVVCLHLCSREQFAQYLTADEKQEFDIEGFQESLKNMGDAFGTFFIYVCDVYHLCMQLHVHIMLAVLGMNWNPCTLTLTKFRAHEIPASLRSVQDAYSWAAEQSDSVENIISRIVSKVRLQMSWNCRGHTISIFERYLLCTSAFSEPCYRYCLFPPPIRIFVRHNNSCNNDKERHFR